MHRRTFLGVMAGLVVAPAPLVAAPASPPWGGIVDELWAWLGGFDAVRVALWRQGQRWESDMLEDDTCGCASCRAEA